MVKKVFLTILFLLSAIIIVIIIIIIIVVVVVVVAECHYSAVGCDVKGFCPVKTSELCFKNSQKFTFGLLGSTCS